MVVENKKKHIPGDLNLYVDETKLFYCDEFQLWQKTSEVFCSDWRFCRKRKPQFPVSQHNGLKIIKIHRRTSSGNDSIMYHGSLRYIQFFFLILSEIIVEACVYKTTKNYPVSEH